MPPGETSVESPQEREFFRALRSLHVKAGRPSSRNIAAKIGGMSHTTINLALRGSRVPTWPVVVKLVEALDGDVESFRILWMATQEPSEIPAPSEESEIRVFVSYAHIDDEATYSRISKLVVDIANTYQSMTGNTVGIFKDVESIEAGEDWRDRIRAGLSYSLIFLAFITPAYLRSRNCREELSEFLAFLTSSSAERLVLPLIFTKRDRLQRSFAEDDLWIKIEKLHSPDISDLRYVEPGSPKWIEVTEELADRIDRTLSSFNHVAEAEPAKKHPRKLDDSVPAGTLERMAELEEKVPQVIDDMSAIASLVTTLGQAFTDATPELSKVDTFAARLGVSRRLANEIAPIADEIESTADRLVSNFSEWDFFVQYILEYARNGGDLTDTDVMQILGGLWALARSGGSALSEVDNFAQILTQGLGISRDLDRPIMKIRDASLGIADLSGMLDGWKTALEVIENDYLNEGDLDNMASSI